MRWPGHIYMPWCNWYYSCSKDSFSQLRFLSPGKQVSYKLFVVYLTNKKRTIWVIWFFLFLLSTKITQYIIPNKMFMTCVIYLFTNWSFFCMKWLFERMNGQKKLNFGRRGDGERRKSLVGSKEHKAESMEQLKVAVSIFSLIKKECSLQRVKSMGHGAWSN